LSKKKGQRAWVEPHYDGDAEHIVFTVKREQDGDDPKLIQEGTVNRRGGRCIVSDEAIPFDYIRAEGKAGRIGAQLMAIVTEAKGGRSYYAPTLEQETTAQVSVPDDAPDTDLPEEALGFRIQNYGLTKHRHLFSPRQLTAMTTFGDLITQVRDVVLQDCIAIGLQDDEIPLRHGGVGAKAYAEAIGIYLSFFLERSLDLNN